MRTDKACGVRRGENGYKARTFPIWSNSGDFIKISKTPGRREKLFCLYYSMLCNGREAAVRAGYHGDYESVAAKLLARSDIRREVTALCAKGSSVRSEVEAGYRRLAFGSVADAVGLMLSDEPVDKQVLESMDLFNVSDIKRPKGGGIEIKFFDRLKALEKLGEMAELNDSGAPSPLFEALNRSALAISGCDDDAEE